MATNGIEQLDEVRIDVPGGIEVSDGAVEIMEQCQQFLLSVPKGAQRDDLKTTLETGLERIASLADPSTARARLYPDDAPLSFGWQAGGLVGGLLFHGPHDGFGSGAFPTFAVTLTPTVGWALHT